MGAALESATEGRVVDSFVRNFLSRGTSGGAVIWGGDMGDIGANGTEVKGGSYGFPATEVRVVAEGGNNKNYFRERRHNCSIPTWIRDRQQ